MLFVIEVNGSIEKFESLMETQNRIDELRRKGIKFDIYRTITFDGVTEKKEIGKDLEKKLFRKLHHMTIKKMFRIKKEMEDKINRYKTLSNDWKEYSKIYMDKESRDNAIERSEIWGDFARMEEENYNKHIEEMQKAFLIPYDEVEEKVNDEEVKEMVKNVTVEEKIMTDLMKVVKKLGNGYNGKRVGNDIYIYSECLPYGYLGRYKKALRVIEKKYDSEVLNKKHVVRFNTKNDDDISIMEVKNFDTEREPTIGNSYKIDLDTNSATFTKEKNNPYIYHHKWMFVSDNYNRFDIEESKLWSIKWKKTLPKGRKTTSSIGYLKQWNNFLNEYGLEVEEKNNTNKFLDVVLNGGIVEKYNRYYKYNTKEKRFYYTDYSINNNWKKSNMNIKDFCDIDWNIV